MLRDTGSICIKPLLRRCGEGMACTEQINYFLPRCQSGGLLWRQLRVISGVYEHIPDLLEASVLRYCTNFF